ncbi:MAG: hypothetical protein J0H14_10730 [Alphaproteobacteria bacterium]|nr:hypothetical protein [Alphaproteobacteria bacterium]
MTLHPAVVVHGLGDALETLAVGRPVTLLSARGAALYAGCLWWREMVTRARAAHPAVPALDILDCADAPGRALAAIRAGQRILVLAPAVPGFPAVAAIAAAHGLILLTERPPAIDLAGPGGVRGLPAWLASA